MTSLELSRLNVCLFVQHYNQLEMRFEGACSIILRTELLQDREPYLMVVAFRSMIRPPRDLRWPRATLACALGLDVEDLGKRNPGFSPTGESIPTRSEDDGRHVLP